MTVSPTTSLLLTLLTLAGRAASDNRPNLQWDPATAPDCVEWYDNTSSNTCSEIRSYFAITPEQFHAWNPSLGLDCSGWRPATSYCIVTLGRLRDTYRSKSISNTVATATVILATTTYTTTYTATPTIWRSTGCYGNDPAKSGLDYEEAVEGGMTPEKCQWACYGSRIWFFALQAGKRCWCSVMADVEKVDEARCNVPCEGDSGKMCGGKDAVELYVKETFPPLPSSLSMDWMSTTGTGVAAVEAGSVGGGSGGSGSAGAGSGGGASGGGSGSAVASAVETRASSGAGKQKALFGILG